MNLINVQYKKPNAFYNKRFQTLFKDQLDRTKATCSFNKACTVYYNLYQFMHGGQPVLRLIQNTEIPFSNGINQRRNQGFKMQMFT